MRLSVARWLRIMARLLRVGTYHFARSKDHPKPDHVRLSVATDRLSGASDCLDQISVVIAHLFRLPVQGCELVIERRDVARFPLCPFGGDESHNGRQDANYRRQCRGPSHVLTLACTERGVIASGSPSSCPPGTIRAPQQPCRP